MGFPPKLKDMNFFEDGTSYKGRVTEVTLPKLALKLEDYRAGGMAGPVPVDFGLEKIELEFKAGGLVRGLFRQFGASAMDATLNRFAGSYQDDATGRVLSCQIVTRGRTMEIDMGSAKPGDDTEQTFKTVCSYYKLEVDGEEWIEIDMIGGIFRVFGKDRRAAIRAAIGA
ncbi:MAG: phage major tail tube protein [Novosphingobium sp.]